MAKYTGRRHPVGIPVFPLSHQPEIHRLALPAATLFCRVSHKVTGRLTARFLRKLNNPLLAIGQGKQRMSEMVASEMVGPILPCGEKEGKLVNCHRNPICSWINSPAGGISTECRQIIQLEFASLFSGWIVSDYPKKSF